MMQLPYTVRPSIGDTTVFDRYFSRPAALCAPQIGTSVERTRTVLGPSRSNRQSTASAYRDGEKVCECSVILGGGMTGGIAYAMRDYARSGFNESLPVENDDQSLYFKTMGMHRQVDQLTSSVSKVRLSFSGIFSFGPSSKASLAKLGRNQI